MGYQIYWMNGRWQGYGVPAYCDIKNCNEKIDRGMSYNHPQDIDIFCCEKHQDKNINMLEIEYKEHPLWLTHILNDDSWKKWRTSNPEIVEEYKNLLDNNHIKLFNVNKPNFNYKKYKKYISNLFNDLIDQWHFSDSKKGIHKYLNISQKDYNLWVNDPNFIPKRFKDGLK
jgi:hypothetical protein